MLFVDGSTVSIGPNASLRLDKFVYDTDAQEGELVVSVSKGLFRFVGGKISKKNAVLFKAPTAVIGIRGGVAMVQVNTPQQIAAAKISGQNLPPAAATMLYGDQVTMQVGTQTQTITRPGFMISQNSGGGVSSPQKATQAQLNQALATLEEPQTPPPGEDGAQTAEQLAAIAPAGGGPVVGDDDVAGSQMATLGSDNSPSSVAAVDPGTSPVGGTTGTGGGGLGVLDDINGNPEDQLQPCTVIGQTNCITVEVTSTQEETPPLVEEIAGPLSIPGAWSGRVNSSSTSSLGISDSSGFQNGTVFEGVFNVAANDFEDTPGGSFTVPAGTDTFRLAMVNGFPVTGFGTLLEGDEFLVYEFTIDNSPTRVAAWAGLPTPGSAFPTNGVTHYNLRPDFVLNSRVPFIRGISGGSSVPDGFGGAFIDWGASGTPPFAGWRVAVQGAGSEQSSAVGVLVGRVFDPGDPANASIFAYMRGTSRSVTSEFVETIRSEIDGLHTQRDSSLAGSNAFFGTTAPNYFVLGSGETPTKEFTSTVASNAAEYRPSVVAAATTGSTIGRTHTTMYGYAAGAAQEIYDGDIDPVYLFESDGSCCGNAFSNGYFPNDVTIILDPTTGTFNADFDLLDLDDDLGNDLNMFFGCTALTCTAGIESVYLDNNTFAAIEDPDEIGSIFTGGYLTSQTDAKLYLVTSDFFDSDGLLPSADTLCDCEYVTWGFWGGTNIDDDHDENVRIHLATWVAGGDICNGCTLPISQIATYRGHLIGNVLTANNLYIAAGNYEQTVRFGAANAYTYDINVTNFDVNAANPGGTSFDSTVNSPGGFNGSGGSFGAEVTSGNKRMVVYGSFNGGGGDTAAEVLGGFRIRNTSGSSYDAAGIIAAKKVSSVNQN